LSTYSVVLFVHILSLLLAAGASAVITLAAIQMRRVETLGQVARWAMAAKSTAKAFPIAVAGLVGSGIYMTQASWSFSDPWVLGAICGLTTIVVLGDAVDGRHVRALGQAVGEALRTGGDGPVDGEVARRLEQPIGKVVALAPTLLMLGVAFVMVTKPGAAGTAVALLVSLALSVPVGPTLLRSGTRAGAPAPAASQG
jgi:Predicted integral membrane protein (DUF2269)